MKFFIDTANLKMIQEAQDLGILDGVTTNPSLMAKEGISGQKNIIEHYTKINFNEYALQNAGRVFINNQDQLELLPVQPCVSESASAFLIKVKVRKITASILSFGLISRLYYLIGEGAPGIVNTNLKGRKLLTFWLVGKLFPKSFIRHRLGSATNFSINFEYALLSTLSTIIIIKMLTIIHQKFLCRTMIQTNS